MEKILVNLLFGAQGDDVKTAICEAVQVMSPNLASTDCFRDLGICTTLTLNHSNINTHITKMIRECLKSSVAGAIPEIVKLLNSKNLRLKESATEALCGLINTSKANAL